MTRERFRQLSPTTRVAFVLIALGLIILLGRLSLFSGASLLMLSRFWPLLLVGFGLDLLGKRPHPAISYGMLSVFAVLFLVLFGPALGLAGRLRAETFSVPLGTTRSAEVDLEPGAAPLEVSALSGTADLLRADITHRSRVTLNPRGRADKTVRLVERSGWLGTKPTDGSWSVGLTRDVPLELNVDSGSGAVTLDLSGLALRDLELDGGAGRTDVTLPASRERYEASWDGGSGHTSLTILEGATFDFGGDGGSGGLEVVFGENVSASLELDGGSGPMTFTLPENTEARVEIEDSGSGALQLSERFRRVDGDDEDEDEGTWETPGFAGAERAVTIRVQDSGSGRLSVR